MFNLLPLSGADVKLTLRAVPRNSVCGLSLKRREKLASGAGHLTVVAFVSEFSALTKYENVFILIGSAA